MLYFPQTPPQNPPPGGDQDKAPLLRAVIGVELCVCTIVIAARIYTRLRLVRNAGWDDGIMLATFLCAITGSSISLVGMRYGIGRHVFYLSRELGVKATKLDWIAQAFVIPAVTIGKISVVFFILRISNTKWHSWFLHTINVILVIINIPVLILTYAQCKPAALLWDPSLHGYCWDPYHFGVLGYFQGCFGAVTDFLLAVFPILILWSLQIPRKRKILLASIMCLGVFSAIAGSVKTFYLQQLKSRADFIYDGTDFMIWYTTEMYVIIIAGSLPTLRPLAQKVFVMSKSRSSGPRGLHQYQLPDRHSHPLKPYNTKLSHYRSDARARESESDQNILQAGITKVTDIAIDYDTRKCDTERGQKEWDSGGDDTMGSVTTAVGPVERV